MPGETEAKQFVIGETFRHNTTAGYQKIERIKGHVISEAEALEVLKNAPVCTLIVQDHGQADLVWEPKEIDRRRALITYFYIAGVPFFVLAMMAALQGWYCAGRPPSP